MTATSEGALRKASTNQNVPRVLLPVYVRLQALENRNVALWESVPKNFSDHIATIDSKVLAMFVSSNSLGFNLSKDNVDNLWMTANYSLNAGDYISTLTWMSSQTVSEDLSSLGFLPFPSSYPDEVGIFLDPGKKIQVENQTIQEMAAFFNQTQGNMTQTVKNILDFVNEQQYDPDKTRLLLSGNLNTTDVLNVFKDALQVLETNMSICIERSWYAAALLRAAGVPARTVTDVRLKTWVQVWLGENIGWVDAETLCAEPPPHVGMFPKPLSTHVPWMIENSSNAMLPFTWLPAAPMRVANLTFGDVELFDVNEFRTVLSEPTDVELFIKDPTKFRFPIVFKPEIVYAAIIQEGSNLTFSLFKGKENASTSLTLGEWNTAALGDLMVSFKPIRQENFLILQGFTVGEVWKFDIRLLVPIVGVPVVAVVVWLYWRKFKQSR
jgi:hypothetical protein